MPQTHPQGVREMWDAFWELRQDRDTAVTEKLMTEIKAGNSCSNRPEREKKNYMEGGIWKGKERFRWGSLWGKRRRYKKGLKAQGCNPSPVPWGFQTSPDICNFFIVWFYATRLSDSWCLLVKHTRPLWSCCHALEDLNLHWLKHECDFYVNAAKLQHVPCIISK